MSARITMLSFSSLCAGITFDASDRRERERQEIAPPMANAYVCAIGAKMTPDTPVIVKSGRNATPMMSVENVIGVATSRALCRMRSVIVPFPWGPRWRKMFSIMMTVESTTMPKSTAPSEMRFADVRVATSPHERDEERERDVDRGDERRARVPQEDEEDRRDQAIPTSRFSITVCVVSFTRLPRS